MKLSLALSVALFGVAASGCQNVIGLDGLERVDCETCFPDSADGGQRTSSPDTVRGNGDDGSTVYSNLPDKLADGGAAPVSPPANEAGSGPSPEPVDAGMGPVEEPEKDASSPPPPPPPPEPTNPPFPGFYFDRGIDNFQLLSPDEALQNRSKVTWDANVGSPKKGSLKVELAYTALRQNLMLAYRPPAPMNYAGKVVHVAVRLDTDATRQTPDISLKFYVKTGDGYIYADNGFFVLTANEWLDFTLDMDNPKGTNVDRGRYDAKQVREIGIEFNSSERQSHLGPALVRVDSFSVR